MQHFRILTWPDCYFWCNLNLSFSTAEGLHQIFHYFVQKIVFCLFDNYKWNHTKLKWGVCLKIRLWDTWVICILQSSLRSIYWPCYCATLFFTFEASYLTRHCSQKFRRSNVDREACIALLRRNTSICNQVFNFPQPNWNIVFKFCVLLVANSNRKYLSTKS